MDPRQQVVPLRKRALLQHLLIGVPVGRNNPTLVKKDTDGHYRWHVSPRVPQQLQQHRDHWPRRTSTEQRVGLACQGTAKTLQ
jgi:hypothetical protein